MIVDLNFDLFAIDEKTKIAKANMLISNILASESKGDSIKLFDWALSFYKGLSVTMDSSDLMKLKEIISNNETLTVLAKAPILKYLDTVK
jgi:hypothetical protein